MRVFTLALAAKFLIAGTSVAMADWVETFGSAAPDQTWDFASLQGIPEQPDSGTFSATSGGGQLLLQDSRTIGAGGAAAGFGLVVTESFSSPGVVVRSVLNPNGIALAEDIGVLAHLHPEARNGYALTIDFDGTGGSFDLSRITNSAATGIGSGTISDFNPLGTYIVELTVAGPQITGRVFDSEENLLGTLESTDETPWPGGLAGVVAQTGASNALFGAFGLTSATAVPEPSSLVALGMLGITGVYLRRRRMAAR